MTQGDKNESAKDKALEPLGFKRINGTELFHHATLNRNFDFANTSISNIPFEIFTEGVDVGGRKVQKSIHKVLGIMTKKDARLPYRGGKR